MTEIVACAGSCGRKFEKDKAINDGSLMETGICPQCYAAWAKDPNQCFGKIAEDGKPLANRKDPTCAKCQEFNICLNWEKLKSKTKKEKPEMGRQKAAPAEPTNEEFTPIDETQPEPAPVAVPRKSRKAAAPAPPPQPAPPAQKRTRKAATPEPAPAAHAAPVRKARTAKTDGKTPESPYQTGSARDIMFRMMKQRYCSVEEIVKATQGVAQHPEAVFAGNFHPRRNKLDNNEKYFKWTVQEKAGKFRVVIGQ
jgi:hypothetical protein